MIMKRTALFALIALGLISCSNGKKCTIHGTIEAEDCRTEDSKVMVSYMVQEEPDTLDIEDGKFNFTCTADPTTLRQLAIIHSDNPMARPDVIFQFIPEAGKMSMTISEDHEVKLEGGKLNDAFTQYNETSSNQIENYRALLRDGDEESADKLFDEVVNFNKDIYEANRDNFIGLQAFYLVSFTATLEEMEKYMAEAEPFVAGDERFVSILEGLRKKAESGEGTMFKDFSGTTPAGVEVRLSDFVGKGNYTLVDFWASWCGPCKREMPNIKELHSKYSSKGLTVVSVAVWDGDNSTSRTTIKELGMDWNQIFTGNDNTATEIYGIEAIPHLILFAPDGTILKRDLRGEELKEYVKNLY